MIAMLANHLWQSTLVALALGALTLTLRHHAARLRYGVWFIASAKFLVPFAAAVALGQQLGVRTLSLSPPPAFVARTLEVSSMAIRIVEPVVAVVPTDRQTSKTLVATPPTARRFDLSTALLFVWAMGTLGVLGTWLSRWLKLAAAVRRSKPLMTVAREGTRLEVRVTTMRLEPGVIGVVRPVLLLPDGLVAKLTSAQLRTVFEHELCHVRRRDNLTAAVHMLVEALFWFHPVIWWIGARLVEERERACDEAVLTATGDAQSYAEAIIAVCETYVRSPLKCAVGIAGREPLSLRITRLLSSPRVRALSRIQGAALAATAAALVVGPLAIGVMNASIARAQEAGAGPSVAVRNDSDPPGIWVAGPRITAIDTSLRELVAFAFHLQKSQITGPAGLDSPRYTVVGELPVVDYSDGTDPQEQYRAYVRSLLEQRFDLVAHREAAAGPTYSLLSGAWTPGIQQVPDGGRTLYFARGWRPCAQPGCPPVPAPPNVIEARNIPISMLVEFLASTFDTPVVDRTNLTGHYDFTLRWPPEAARADRMGLPSDEVLRKAVEEQLGLTLLAANAPIERVVIDRLADARSAAALPSETSEPPAVILREVINKDVDGPVLKLEIDRFGSMRFGPGTDGDTALDADSVVAIAAAALRRDPNITLLVRADGLVANHRVVEAANLLARAGATRIRFDTLPVRLNSLLDDSSALNRSQVALNERTGQIAIRADRAEREGADSVLTGSVVVITTAPAPTVSGVGTLKPMGEGRYEADFHDLRLSDGKVVITADHGTIENDGTRTVLRADSARVSPAL